MRTDSGREFQGAFHLLLQHLGITHVTTRPVSPWTNGRAERMVRTVKSSLKRTMAARNTDDWEPLLPWLQAAINATVSRSTGFTPHEILFGEPPSPLLPGHELPPIPDNSALLPMEDYLRALRKRLNAIHVQVRTA